VATPRNSANRHLRAVPNAAVRIPNNSHACHTCGSVDMPSPVYPIDIILSATQLVSNGHLSSCYQNYWRAHWSVVFDTSASKSKVFVSSVSSMRFWICRPTCAMIIRGKRAEGAVSPICVDGVVMQSHLLLLYLLRCMQCSVEPVQFRSELSLFCSVSCDPFPAVWLRC
jgi:hypothetical protein